MTERPRHGDTTESAFPPSAESAPGLVRSLALLLVVIALAWAIDAPGVIGTTFLVEQFAILSFGIALAITFLSTKRNRTTSDSLSPLDAVLAALGLAASLYAAVRFPALAENLFSGGAETLVLSIVLGAVALEAIRRAVGWPMLVLVALFLAYGMFGHVMPGRLQTIETSISTFLVYSVFGSESLLGKPLIIVSTIVTAFVVFGQIFAKAGGGEFITEIAMSTTGRFRGGPAKVAIVASGTFGSISGSVVSNVMSTGVVSIPLMRRIGFPATTAAGIEAVASTGGQFMPPIMGAGAFLMADFLQINYSDVVTAALVPAVLFFFALLIYADQFAARLGLEGAESQSERIPFTVILKGMALLFVPLLGLFAAVIHWGRTPSWAAVFAIALTLVVGMTIGYRGRRLTLTALRSTLVYAGLTAAKILIMGAAAGFIVGIVNMTGLGLSAVFALTHVGGESIFLLLALTALVAMVLGTGLPTTAVYVIVASILAPVLVAAGIDPLAAHLFIFYTGMLSMITPPIAFASLAASALANTGFLATSLAALRFGWPAYVLPFLFVVDPALLLMAPLADVVLSIAFTGIGLWFAISFFTGYFVGHLGRGPRVGLLIAGTGLLVPGLTGYEELALRAAALALGVTVVYLESKRHQKAEAGGATE